MNIRYIISFLFTIASLLVGCNYQQNKSDSLFDELDSNNLKRGTAIFAQEADSVRLKKYAHELAYQISKKNIYLGPYIGMGQTGNEQYKRFNWLLDSASESTLIDLYHYDNLVTKAYVFDILSMRKYKGLKDLFEQNIGNANKFETQSGCFGSYMPFNYFMYKCMEDQLTEAEKIKYKTILSKYVDAKTWNSLELFNF